jgi:N-acyl amino acid synthase of PEP-CTERM/exosortase system
VRMSIENGITHWCAVMEPTLLRLLTRLGIHFEPIGPMIEYHGRRQPCYIPLEVLLPRVQRERPDVWDVITRGGKHWADLCHLMSEEVGGSLNVIQTEVAHGRPSARIA